MITNVIGFASTLRNNDMRFKKGSMIPMKKSKKMLSRVMATALSAMTIMGGSATALYATSLPVFATATVAETLYVSEDAKVKDVDNTDINVGVSYKLLNTAVGTKIKVEQSADLQTNSSVVKVSYGVFYYIGKKAYTAKTVYNTTANGLSKEDLESTYIAFPSEDVDSIVIKQYVKYKTKSGSKITTPTDTQVVRILDYKPIALNASTFASLKRGTVTLGTTRDSGDLTDAKDFEDLDTDMKTVLEDGKFTSDEGVIAISTSKQNQSNLQYRYCIKSSLADHVNDEPVVLNDEPVVLNNGSEGTPGWSTNTGAYVYSVDLDDFEKSDSNKYREGWVTSKEGLKTFKGVVYVEIRDKARPDEVVKTEELPVIFTKETDIAPESNPAVVKIAETNVKASNGQYIEGQDNYTADGAEIRIRQGNAVRIFTNLDSNQAHDIVLEAKIYEYDAEKPGSEAEKLGSVVKSGKVTVKKTDSNKNKSVFTWNTSKIVCGTYRLVLTQTDKTTYNPTEPIAEGTEGVEVKRMTITINDSTPPLAYKDAVKVQMAKVSISAEKNEKVNGAYTDNMMYKLNGDDLAVVYENKAYTNADVDDTGAIVVADGQRVKITAPKITGGSGDYSYTITGKKGTKTVKFYSGSEYTEDNRTAEEVQNSYAETVCTEAGSTYTFTIRVHDNSGKVADVVLTQVVKVKSAVVANPVIKVDGVALTLTDGKYKVKQGVREITIDSEFEDENIAVSKVYYEYWYPTATATAKTGTSKTLTLKDPQYGEYIIRMLYATDDGRYAVKTVTIEVEQSNLTRLSKIYSGGTEVNAKSYTEYTKIAPTGDTAEVVTYSTDITAGDYIKLGHQCTLVTTGDGKTVEWDDRAELLKGSTVRATYKPKTVEMVKSTTKKSVNSPAKTKDDIAKLENVIVLPTAGTYRITSIAKVTDVEGNIQTSERVFYVNVVDSDFDFDVDFTSSNVVKGGAIAGTITSTKKMSSVEVDFAGSSHYNSKDLGKVTFSYNTGVVKRYWVRVRAKDETGHEVVKYYPVSSATHIYNRNGWVYTNVSTLSSGSVEDSTADKLTVKASDGLTVKFKMTTVKEENAQNAQGTDGTLSTKVTYSVWAKGINTNDRTGFKLVKKAQSTKYFVDGVGPAMVLTEDDIVDLRAKYGDDVVLLIRENVQNIGGTSATQYLDKFAMIKITD